MDFSNHEADNVRFAKEYRLVGTENVFEYVSVIDVHMIAGGKKGIVLFGNPSNKWVEYYANIVNDVALEVGIDTIYYYDFYKDRDQNNATYEDTLKLLSNYVIHNDLNKTDIYSPTLLVVCNGEVILFDTDTNFINGNKKPNEYWSIYNRNLKKNQLRSVFKTYLES